MFYIAQKFLLEQKISFSSHSAVISAFGKNFAKSGIVPNEMHRWLIDAQARNIKDFQNIPQLQLLNPFIP
jgi:uncharacterized protein (UPF0332 family)